MAITIQRLDPASDKPSLWAFRIDRPGYAFDSRSVSIRLTTRESADWLATLVDRLSCGPRPQLDWTGDLDDDCSIKWMHFYAHAEHMSGPRRGGNWYCSVQDETHRYFHTADRQDCRPKTSSAARWMCETIMTAAAHGLVHGYQN